MHTTTRTVARAVVRLVIVIAVGFAVLTGLRWLDSALVAKGSFRSPNDILTLLDDLADRDALRLEIERRGRPKTLRDTLR